MHILYFLALIQVFLKFFLFRSKKTLVILISLNIGALFIIILFGYYPWVPKFWVPNPHGYPWVIPKKTQNFELYGYPTRKYPWNSDTNPTQPIPKIWFGSGYYPWVPELWVPNPRHSNNGYAMFSLHFMSDPLLNIFAYQARSRQKKCASTA